MEETKLTSDTLLLRKCEVPLYLQNGEFFKSLNDEDDEPILLSINTVKFETSVGNVANLKHLLSSIRFWGVREVPAEVISFCLYHNDVRTDVEAVLNEFAKQFLVVDILLQMLSLDVKEQAKLAIQSGILAIVEALQVDCCALTNCCALAASAGHPHILKYLHELGGLLSDDLLVVSLSGGYIKDFSYESIYGNSSAPPQLPRHSEKLSKGRKECFQYALQQGCKWDRNSSRSLCTSDVFAEALQYAIAFDYPLSVYETAEAASSGAFLCLRILHQQANCPWGIGTCANAAGQGSLDCLQYAHEHGCPWDYSSVRAAILNGHNDCVQYATTHGCEIDDQSCNLAAIEGNALMLQYLHSAGAYWDVTLCKNAAKFGHLSCLQFAHEHGCPWDEQTCLEAIAHRHVECLQYALQQGCPHTLRVCELAAAHGDVDSLKCAHEHGCSWGVGATAVAAELNRLACLQYLHEHGCPWDVSITTGAAVQGNLSCLQYAYEHGCPVSRDACQLARSARRLDCAEFISTYVRVFK